MAHSKFDFEAEMSQVRSLFVEDLELFVWNTGWHTTFRVASVDGSPAKHRILIDYYDDQVYRGFSERDPSRLLSIADLDVTVRYGEVSNYANRQMRVLRPDASMEGRSERLYVRSGDKLSLRDLLAQSYRMGGYGNRPNLRNSNGITETVAAAMADEALGGPSLREAARPTADGASRRSNIVGKENHGLLR